MQEISRSIEWIDDPSVGLVSSFLPSALFADKAVAGSRLGKFLAQNLLRPMVGSADEIARAFERDLQVFDLAEITREATCGLARRSDHDVEQRRPKHWSGVPASGPGGRSAEARSLRSTVWPRLRRLHGSRRFACS